MSCTALSSRPHRFRSERLEAWRIIREMCATIDGMTQTDAREYLLYDEARKLQMAKDRLMEVRRMLVSRHPAEGSAA